MKKKGNNIKLGIFVSIGLFLFIITVYFVGKKQQLFGSTITIKGIFKDINGLQPGNNVRLSGINIGVVSDIIILADTEVLVNMSVDAKVQKFISRDSKATIGSEGLMGNKTVVILPGTVTKSNAIRDNDYIVANAPVNMDDLTSKLRKTTNNITDITDDLAVIMDNIRNGKGTVGKLFMDSTLARNINQAVVNIRQGAGGFKQNMDAASHSFLLRGIIKKEKKKAEEKKEK